MTSTMIVPIDKTIFIMFAASEVTYIPPNASVGSMQKKLRTNSANISRDTSGLNHLRSLLFDDAKSAMKTIIRMATNIASGIILRN